MTVFTLPAIIPAPDSFDFFPQSNTQTYTSPLDRSTQTLEVPGTRWTASPKWSLLTAPQWRALNAFLASLRGASGRFYLGPYHALAPQAAISGAPVVNGAAQTGGTLATRGWAANGPVLQVGDYFHFDNGIGRELKIVVGSPGAADGTGHATLTIEPPIRVSPPDSQALVTLNPTSIMRLTDDQQGQGSYAPGTIGSNGFDAIESF